MTLENYLYEQNIHWLGNTLEAGTERDLLQPLLPFVEINIENVGVENFP